MSKYLVTSVLFGLAAHSLTNQALAADCACDHEIPVSTQVVDGADAGIQPGDRVCVTAGEREFLRFKNLQGTAADPIVVTNCGGLVRIHNTERAYALVFEDDSKHFHLTGTGDDTLTYGFEISAPDKDPYPGVGLWLNGRSTNYEVDHVEIHDTGFAGVSAKTDPKCDGSADQGNFVQRDVSFHHLYIHDTGGEGMYIGSTQAGGQTITCNGSSEVHQPHFLEGIIVTDTLIERTGWDGAQIGMAHKSCTFARNVIRDVGLEGVQYQQQGLQIGSFSKCDIYQNILRNGPTNGIFVLDADDTWVHSNLVVNFQGTGIYANIRDQGVGKKYRFHFNTIADAGDGALKIFGGALGPSEGISNLVIGGGAGVAAGGDVDWTANANVEYATAAEAGLVGGGDYHVQVDAPVRGSGAAVSGVDRDLDGVARLDPPTAGAYEYRDPSVDAGPGPAGGGPGAGGASAGGTSSGGNASGGTAAGNGGSQPSTGGTSGEPPANGADSGSDDGGCGCRAAGDQPSPLRALALGLVAIGLWRRRRQATGIA